MVGVNHEYTHHAKFWSTYIDIRLNAKTIIDEILNLFFESYCEKQLRGPLFIKDYPLDISPLAKKMDADPRLTCRFEAFIAGQEVANAFTELNDPLDQRERFERQKSTGAEGHFERVNTPWVM